ncbi:unnamed protein product [Rotaria sordida]|uniref:F-box domain-containing protein n=1 Tax=Rotaria sordida TaxID=392033 RepID=A0A819F583_9BILA|nr:unnamed protein product [Rotaria sordida]
MNQSNIHLLDLPNEILLIILKKLDNIDVLYSLFGINNERLDNLVQEDVFTNTLNFARTSSITDNKLDQFCTYILPQSHHCIKKLVLETISMKRILLAGDYPNLTSLELFRFGQEQISHFRDGSVFRHIFQYQITDLILHNDDEYISKMRLDTYTENVYNYTSDCDELVVPLLRRMTHLEKLTLYLRIHDRNTFIDGTYLQNEILVHMLQLHTFIFYISTETVVSASLPRKSEDDIQRTFTNIKYGQTACIIDYFTVFNAICNVYSLPFTFTRLEKITNGFPTIIFNNVTRLHAYDATPMKHEFFMRISRAFPLLKYFSIENEAFQSWNLDEWESDENSSYSVIEYSHLTSLDITCVNKDYVVQFLLETKMHLPRLTELKVNYHRLKIATMNFTRDKTRHNCSNVKRLIVVEAPKVFSQEFYQYFPLL